MLELINQLDGFDPRGNIKVLMATNRPDTLDPALCRPGRLDRKVEFSLPELEVINLYILITPNNGIYLNSNVMKGDFSVIYCLKAVLSFCPNSNAKILF